MWATVWGQTKYLYITTLLAYLVVERYKFVVEKSVVEHWTHPNFSTAVMLCRVSGVSLKLCGRTAFFAPWFCHSYSISLVEKNTQTSSPSNQHNAPIKWSSDSARKCSTDFRSLVVGRYTLSQCFFNDGLLNVQRQTLEKSSILHWETQ